MFRTKSELRVIATFTIIVSTIFSADIAQAKTPITPPVSAAQKYLASQFVNGRFIEGFTAGVADYGFTLEAITQRAATGDAKSALAPAVKFNLLSATHTGTKANRKGFLFDAETKKLKVGLAAKWLFTSQIASAKNTALRSEVLDQTLQSVNKQGVVSLAGSNSMDYSWITFGLWVNGKHQVAKLVANQLSRLQHSDGGFGPDASGDPSVSSVDSTGLAIQALRLVADESSKSQISKLSSSLRRAVSYLTQEAKGSKKDHWESWGDLDVNGSEYAIMALSCLGVNVKPHVSWLKNQIASDGGIAVPWAPGAGDRFATAQGLLPLAGISYYDLAKK